ncbi:hypothetical protein J2Z82_001197 [Virgibacillus litoralis]|uniref:Uncharacterized protein n=1 Tax=Virgibacillus litoralis TaxID=578221 RepID=A0ABS4HBH4_9BACI|nr:hypothetical protein [Virgibacillus litoralis]
MKEKEQSDRLLRKITSVELSQAWSAYIDASRTNPMATKMRLHPFSDKLMVNVT